MTKVVIGVQARSTSTRLPNKIQEFIGGKTVLDHVLGACFRATQYLNNWGDRKLTCQVAVLTPYGDPLLDRLDREVTVIEGPEQDVLSRYMNLVQKMNPDYVCRVTSDCPLLPHFVISKLINLAAMNHYDYVSNVDERCRTSADGMDCEVISRRALEYADKNAEGTDREHVTTYLRQWPAQWMVQGCVVNFLDLSSLKLSIDTGEDLAKVKQEFEKIEAAYQRAVHIFGKGAVHRF